MMDNEAAYETQGSRYVYILNLLGITSGFSFRNSNNERPVLC